MKKLAFAVLIAAAVFALSQCSLFFITVEYAVSGAGAGLVTVLYNNQDGEGTEIVTPAFWSESFNLFSSKRPFAAALRVTNGTNNFVTASILQDGLNVAGSPIVIASGNTAEMWAWIE